MPQICCRCLPPRDGETGGRRVLKAGSLSLPLRRGDQPFLTKFLEFFCSGIQLAERSAWRKNQRAGSSAVGRGTEGFFDPFAGLVAQAALRGVGRALFAIALVFGDAPQYLQLSAVAGAENTEPEMKAEPQAIQQRQRMIHPLGYLSGSYLAISSPSRHQPPQSQPRGFRALLHPVNLSDAGNRTISTPGTGAVGRGPGAVSPRDWT